MSKSKRMSSIIILGITLSILPSCQSEDQISEAAHRQLIEVSNSPYHVYLNATESGWQVTSVNSVEDQNLAYGTETAPACKSETTPRLSLPANKDITFALTSLKTPSKENPDFPRFCVKEWNINEELVPGLRKGIEVSTGSPRTVCAVCHDEDGRIIAHSTIRLNIIAKND